MKPTFQNIANIKKALCLHLRKCTRVVPPLPLTLIMIFVTD